MLIIHFLKSFYELFINKEFLILKYIEINGDKYEADKESFDANGFLGFFDWLRNKEKEIVGVRLFFFQHHTYRQKFDNFNYVDYSEELNCHLIKFTDDEIIDEYSSDQDFGNNFIYKSSDDNFLLTFKLDQLTKKELRKVKDQSKNLYDHVHYKS